jgi:hypothetical protein
MRNRNSWPAWVADLNDSRAAFSPEVTRWHDLKVFDPKEITAEKEAEKKDS